MQPQPKPNGEVMQYIREARSAGLSDVDIARKLISAGWKKSVLRASFNFLKRPRKKIPSPRLVSRTGLVTIRKNKWKVWLWVSVVLLGLVSVAWLASQLLIVQGKTVLGYSFIHTSLVRTFSIDENAMEFSLRYADPQTLVVRQGQATISLESIHITAEFYSDREFIFTISNGNNTERKIVILESVVASIASNRDMFGSISYKGIDQVAGRPFVHYEGTFEEEFVSQVIAALPRGAVLVGELEVPEKVIAGLLDLWEKQLRNGVMKFSVDILSRQVKDLQFSVPAPSLAALTREAFVDVYVPPTGKGQEVLDKAREIENGLKKFKDKYGGYPESNGGIAKVLIPEFLAAWPGHPEASTCSNFYQEFTYTSQGAAQTKRASPTVYPEFSVTFCMPEDASSIKAGIGILTPSGILTSITCSSGVIGCFTKPLEIVEDTVGDSAGAEISAIFEIVYPERN